MSHASSITTQAVTKLDNTLGAILIGTLFSTTLWGVACTQTYDYFMDNTSDGRLQKSIVSLLWVLDTLGTLTHAHIAYHYLVTSYGDPSTLIKHTWSIRSLALVTGIPNLIIRSMFARRIYQFGRKNIILTTWIVLMTICDFALAIVTVVKAFQGLTPVEISKILYSSIALGLAADLSVTIGLCWLLHTSKSGFRKSDSVVNVLMVYVVNTTLLVSITGMMGLITYVAMPRSMIFLAFFFPAGKLYFNSYLATLNVRARLRGKWESGIPLSQLGIPSSQGNTEGVSMTDEEKTRPSSLYPSATITFSKTVERKVDDV